MRKSFLLENKEGNSKQHSKEGIQRSNVTTYSKRFLSDQKRNYRGNGYQQFNNQSRKSSNKQGLKSESQLGITTKNLNSNHIQLNSLLNSNNLQQKIKLTQNQIKSKAQTSNQDPIFADRRSKQYKNLQKSSNQQTKLKHRIKLIRNNLEKSNNNTREINQKSLSFNKKMISNNLDQDHFQNPLIEDKRKQSSNNKYRRSFTEISTESKFKSEKKISPNSRDGGNLSQLDCKSNNHYYANDKKQDINASKQQKMNYIIDKLGDSRLNSILWNDPTVHKMLQELEVYNEQDLDECIQKNAEYFQNVFKSSPFQNPQFHHMKPNISSYKRQYQSQGMKIQETKKFNDLTQLTMADYECLGKLHLQKKKLSQNSTSYETEFDKKVTSTKQVIPKSYIKLGPDPTIANTTTTQMQLQNRLDYDPTRIFRRLEQKNVVTGAQFAGKTEYEREISKNKLKQLKNQFTMQYIKQRNLPRKTIYTKNSTNYDSTYSREYGDKSSKYNKPLPFKYHTELQKVVNEELPLVAYDTTKSRDFSIRAQQNINNQTRKCMTPWKHKLLTKLKALLQYKKYLRTKKEKK